MLLGNRLLASESGREQDRSSCSAEAGGAGTGAVGGSIDSDFLRRASLDVIGLLPTPEEARAFLPTAIRRSAKS